jgi:hypothetical protein
MGLVLVAVIFPFGTKILRFCEKEIACKTKSDFKNILPKFLKLTDESQKPNPEL